jgi:GTP-binding protein
MMKLLATARFSDTVVKLGKLSQSNPDGLPEVAFVGRSNAGKSSCINLICNRRRLAFSSRTPGRTQALNLFALGPPGPPGPEGEDTLRPLGYLVDTPGYGFAAASPTAKRSWQALAGDYIRQRGPLAGVVLMVDIRRQLTDLDRQLLSWTPLDIPLVIVMTKSDKLGRQQARQAMRQVAQDPLLAKRQASLLILLFSTLSRTGVEDLQQAVEALITGAEIDWAAKANRPGETAPIFRNPNAKDPQALQPSEQTPDQTPDQPISQAANATTHSSPRSETAIAKSAGPAEPNQLELRND